MKFELFTSEKFRIEYLNLKYWCFSLIKTIRSEHVKFRVNEVLNFFSVSEGCVSVTIETYRVVADLTILFTAR